MADAGRERRTCTVRPELGLCGGTGVGSRLSSSVASIYERAALNGAGDKTRNTLVA